MLGKLFGGFCILSFAAGAIFGNLEEVSCAILDGAQSAVTVSLSLCGMMVFWNGLMEVLKEAGVMKRVSKILKPFLKILFPNAAASGEGLEEISANMGANLLGIGNAATPFALSAMEKLQKGKENAEVASGEQLTLAVLNTSSVSLIPSTLLALRRAAGAAEPYRILLPVWICSLTCFLFAALICRLCCLTEKKRA